MLIFLSFLKNCILGWGTLSTQGIVILSGVVCRVSSFVVVTNRVTRQNLRSVVVINLLFFLKVAYHWGEVQSKRKFGKRCEKKVWNRQKRCEITNIEEFSIENPCKSYIFLQRLSRRIEWWKFLFEKGVKKGVKSPKKV